MPVSELSLLIKLPYFGVRGLRGDIGLVRPAHRRALALQEWARGSELHGLDFVGK